MGLPFLRGPINHIHLGTGALGLGLTCWATAQRDMNIYLVNRHKDGDARNDSIRRNKGYYVRNSGTKFEEKIQISGLYYSNVDSDVVDIENIIRDPKTVLLTTALKEGGVDAMAPLMARLLQARAESGVDSKLFFVACENAINSQEVKRIFSHIDDEDLKNKIESHVYFLNSVVDRICNKPAMEQDKVVVLCENYARWHIEKASDDRKHSLSINEIFPHIDDSIRIESRLEPFVYRKKWIVNSAHLIIAMYAHYFDFERIDSFVLQNKSGSALFRLILEEIKQVFLHWNEDNYVFFSEERINRYVNAVHTRISTHPQSVSDATTRFKPDTLVEFYKDLHRKISDPFIQFSEDEHKSLFYIPLIMSYITRLISTNKYVYQHYAKESAS